MVGSVFVDEVFYALDDVFFYGDCTVAGWFTFGFRHFNIPLA